MLPNRSCARSLSRSDPLNPSALPALARCEELPAWGWLGARDELICVVFGPVGGGSCRRCCLPTCSCSLGSWRPAAAITLDRTKHDTLTYCDRQSHPFVGNPIRGRSGGGRCHGLCARVVLCFAFACLPCSPLVPSPLAFLLAFASQDRFCPLPSIGALFGSTSGCRTVQSMHVI